MIFAIGPGFCRFSGFYQPRRNLQFVDTESPMILLRETKVDPNWHVIPFVAEDTENLSDKLARMTFKKIVMDMIQNPKEYLDEQKELDVLRL